MIWAVPSLQSSLRSRAHWRITPRARNKAKRVWKTGSGICHGASRSSSWRLPPPVSMSPWPFGPQRRRSICRRASSERSPLPSSPRRNRKSSVFCRSPRTMATTNESRLRTPNRRTVLQVPLQRRPSNVHRFRRRTRPCPLVIPENVVQRGGGHTVVMRTLGCRLWRRQDVGGIPLRAMLRKHHLPLPGARP